MSDTTWTCPNGHSSPAADDFCGQCGAPRKGAEPDTQRPRWSGRGKLALFVGGAILALLAGTVTWLLVSDRSGDNAERGPDQYLEEVHADPTWDGVTDDQLLQLGRTFCEQLDAGQSPQSLFDGGFSSGVSPTSVTLVYRSAAQNLCQEHEEAVEAYLSEIG